MKVSRTLCAIVAAGMLAGCGFSGTRFFQWNPDRETSTSEARAQKIDYTGINPVIDSANIEPINLLMMIDPNGKGRSIYESRSHSGGSRSWKELYNDERYEYAFEGFTKDSVETEIEKAQRRNRTQDRIVLASDQRCGVYRRLLLQVQSDANFWFGTGATISGLLGPLFGERGAKNLSALAGAFSGTQAQLGQNYFYNLAAPVITKGIDERRKAVLERMRAARATDIHNYTIQAAVKDAVYYDAQCSLISGLEEAAEAIRLVSDPGLESANRTILKAKITREVVSANKPEEIEALTRRIADLEASPIMTTNRFSNIGVPLAGIANVIVSTPAAVGVVLNARRFDYKEVLAEEQNSAVLAATAAENSGKLAAGSTPTPDNTKAALAALDAAVIAFNAATDKCVGKQANRHTAYAALEAQAMSTTAQTTTQESLSLLRRQSELLQRVLTSIRGDIVAARTHWRQLVSEKFARGSAALPAATEARPSLVEAKTRLDKIAASNCSDSALMDVTVPQ